MHADIVSTLGGRRSFGPRFRGIDLLAEVERGLPHNAYTALVAALGLTPEEQDRLLQVSQRTRMRWKRRARIDSATSDRLVRLARVLALASSVLENREHAVAWLREPSDVLRGRTPLAVIATDVGTEKVTNMLHQMEYGIFS